MRHLRAVCGLAGLARSLGVDAPVRRMRLERVVRGAADREHADAVLAGLQRAGRRARRGDRHLHHRLRVARQLQPRLAQVEPVGLLRHHAALHQLDDHVERLVELAPLVLRLQPHLVGVVDQRAGPDPEHRAPARLVVELHHAARERERVVIGQRHHAGAEPDVARALRRRRDEHFGTRDDLEAARMVLADPGLVIVELVEVDQQVHVALERKQRIFARRMERREEHAGFHVAVAVSVMRTPPRSAHAAGAARARPRSVSARCRRSARGR